MAMFRTLKANEIECRVGSGIKTAKWQGVSLLLYKDARVDMNILDETVGAHNWSRDPFECKGALYCRVGINIKRPDGSYEWVYKCDCGTESNTEATKGESSDSFKRACVNWGIGRELYSSPTIMVACELDEKNRPPKGIAWGVSEIEYDENRDISYLVIVQRTRREEVEVFKWGKKR